MSKQEQERLRRIRSETLRVTDGAYKASYAAKAVLTVVGIALAAGHVTVNFQLAFGIFVTFQYWGLLWLKILRDSPGVYSVKVPTMLLDDWIPLSLPGNDGIKFRRDRVVTSISELSGIRGTQMMLSLRVMTSAIMMLVCVAIQQDLHHRGSTLLRLEGREDKVPVFMLVETIGFFLTGHFELNNVDDFHTKGHYLGVLGIFAGSLSLGFVLNWNAVSILLLSLEFALLVIWIWYTESVEKMSDDVAVVTRRSKICIGVELLIFYFTNFMLTVAVYASGKNEGNFWVSPFL